MASRTIICPGWKPAFLEGMLRGGLRLITVIIDLAVGREQAIVEYGDAMGLAADGVRDLQGPGEWPFGIDDPFSGAARCRVDYDQYSRRISG